MAPNKTAGINMPIFPNGMERRLGLLMNTLRPRQQTKQSSLAMHSAAIQEITSWPDYHHTPLIPLQEVAKACNIYGLWFKDESSRFGLGSFKALGGAYAVLRVLQKEILRQTSRETSSEELRTDKFLHITHEMTVTTATDGNHGRSVAWGAQMFGCRCVVYLPKSCSIPRQEAITRFGATTVRTGVGYDETVRICARNAKEKGFKVVSDTSWSGYVDIPRDVMGGYTVMVEEVLLQLPPGEILTHVFVQAGVGGLSAAVCEHFSNRLGPQAPALVVVEPETAACLFASAQAGRPVPARLQTGTIMAGLDCGEVSSLAWDILSAGAAAFVTVPDDVVAPCMRLLAATPGARPSIVAGESAVAGLAALLISAGEPALRSALGLNTSSRALVIGTEGSTDSDIYQSLVGKTPA